MKNIANERNMKLVKIRQVGGGRWNTSTTKVHALCITDRSRSRSWCGGGCASWCGCWRLEARLQQGNQRVRKTWKELSEAKSNSPERVLVLLTEVGVEVGVPVGVDVGA